LPAAFSSDPLSDESQSKTQDRVDIQLVQVIALITDSMDMKALGVLFVTYGDAPEMLDRQEEALDQIALAVKREVTMHLGRVSLSVS